jgi:hypothetical protein
MSRTKPEEHTANPTQFKLEWVGHDGGGFFTVWDREEKKEIKVDLPLRFAYLDTRKSVAGYYESVKRSFFSNEIKPFSKEEFDVRYFKDGNAHPVAKGTWTDIKGEIGGKGGKYCNNVYATLLTSTNEEVPGGSLVKLPFVGAAGSEWIDLDIKDGEAFAITAFEDRKKGRTDYRAPLMEKIEITEDEGVEADEHDKDLQAFFDASKAPKVAEEAPTVAEPTQEPSPELPDEEDDEIPF